VAQCKALFDGYTSGTGSVDVDLHGFCCICEAAATGDRDVAEFADLCVEDFVALEDAPTPSGPTQSEASWRSTTRRVEDTKKIQNDAECLGAATKIQSIFRGNVVRQAGKDLVERYKERCAKLTRA